MKIKSIADLENNLLDELAKLGLIADCFSYDLYPPMGGKVFRVNISAFIGIETEKKPMKKSKPLTKADLKKFAAKDKKEDIKMIKKAVKKAKVKKAKK